MEDFVMRMRIMAIVLERKRESFGKIWKTNLFCFGFGDLGINRPSVERFGFTIEIGLITSKMYTQFLKVR